MDEVEGNKLRRRRVGDIRRAVCGKRQQHEEVCAHQVEHERVDDRGMEFRHRPSATVLVDHVGDGDKESDYRKQDACGEDVAQIYVQSVLASSLLLSGLTEVFAWLCGVAYAFGFLGLARGSVCCGCKRRGLSGLYSPGFAKSCAGRTMRCSSARASLR